MEKVCRPAAWIAEITRLFRADVRPIRRLVVVPRIFHSFPTGEDNKK
jgi:hypothetical protein